MAGKAHPGLGLAVGIFNFVTENTNTRNWQTLPHSIYYTRIKKCPTGLKSLYLRLMPNVCMDEVLCEKVLTCNFEANFTKFVVVNISIVYKIFCRELSFCIFKNLKKYYLCLDSK